MELMLLLPFANNLGMSLIKWLGDRWFNGSQTRNWRLRLVLIAGSLIGVVTTAALNGTPVEVNQVTSLITTFVETVVVAFASHFSYKAIVNA